MTIIVAVVVKLNNIAISVGEAEAWRFDGRDACMHTLKHNDNYHINIYLIERWY